MIVCVCVCVFVRFFVHICVCVCMFVCCRMRVREGQGGREGARNTHTHTHTHTQPSLSPQLPVGLIKPFPVSDYNHHPMRGGGIMGHGTIRCLYVYASVQHQLEQQETRKRDWR